MKISAERLKKIIKEEVQHVRTMPIREEEDPAVLIDQATSIVEQVAKELYGLTDPGDAGPPVGDEYAKQLEGAIAMFNQAHASMLTGMGE